MRKKTINPAEDEALRRQAENILSEHSEALPPPPPFFFSRS